MAAETSEYRMSLPFEHNGNLYKIIDTVGLCDPEQEPEVVFEQLAQAFNAAQQGIDQILVITRGRVTQAQLDIISFLTGILLDENVWDFVTVVRTRFAKFERQEACQNDLRSCQEEHPAFADLLNRAGNRLVHVDFQTERDNPNGWLQRRAASRQVLLDAIVANQPAQSYHPPALVAMQQRYREYEDSLEEQRNAVPLLEAAKARLQELRNAATLDGERFKEEAATLQQQLDEAEARVAEARKETARLATACLAPQAPVQLDEADIPKCYRRSSRWYEF